MYKLYYNTYYHLNDGYVIKTLTKLKSKKVIHIERMPNYESESVDDYYQDYFEGKYES